MGRNSAAGPRGPNGGRQGGPAALDRVLTGADGYFLFRGLALSDYSLTAIKPGYDEGAFGRRRPRGRAQQLILSDWQPRREVVIHIWKYGAITGRVTDESGEALIGVAVQGFARIEVEGARRFVPSMRATTDDRGIYRLSNLPPGDYLVAAASRQIAVPLSMTDQSRDRRAIAQTDVSLGTMPTPGSPTGMQLGNSAYGLDPLGPTPPPPDDDRLFVYPPTFVPAAPSGQASATVTVTLRSGEERGDIDLELRPVRTVRVSGTLAGPADALAMRRVRLISEGNELLDAGEPTASTDAKGAFVFPAVPAGQYSLRTTARTVASRGESVQALYWADVPVTVARDDIDGLTVPLRPGLILTGSLLFDGASPRPPAGTLMRTGIRIERAGIGVAGADASAAALVDDLGRFSTTGLVSGSYYIRVIDSPVGWMFTRAMYNGLDRSEYPVDVDDDLSGITLEFTDRWTGLRGLVTTPSGQIDSAALVLLFPTDVARWRVSPPGNRRMRSARVSENGDFSFGAVPVGEYYVAVVADEEAADWQDPDALEQLSRSATRVTINDGDQKNITLRKRSTRR
jgi:hypothetical protein